jgi:hypothetical protein
MSGKLSCYIAASALVLMVIAVLLNAIYVRETADHILMLADEADRESGSELSSLSELSNYWNERMPILKISLSENELDEIQLAINEAKISAENLENEEYKISMARLRRAIESIKKREEFSIENIF